MNREAGFQLVSNYVFHILSSDLFETKVALSTSKDSMLELSKKVLDKVSFDRKLFRKELRKAIKWVSKEERMALQAWCIVSYGHLYNDVIIDCFAQGL